MTRRIIYAIAIDVEDESQESANAIAEDYIEVLTKVLDLTGLSYGVIRVDNEATWGLLNHEINHV